MKRKFFTPAVCLYSAALVFLAASCRTIDSGERGFREAPSGEQEKMTKDAEKFGAGILQAFRDGDLAAFRRSAPGEMGRRMTEKDFAASRRVFLDKFGEIQDFKLLAELDTPAFGNFVWIVTFVRKNANGAEIRRQLLFRLVTMRTDGKTQVVSCGFL